MNVLNVDGAGMADFLKSFGFIVFFLVLVLLLSITVGDGPTTAFLWLVLLSMMVINASTFTDFIGRFSTV